ncbi:MAG: PEP-CTERM sorting domain-containing protein [Fimbriimonadaceae bacterium]|nr:PEP-CTERM sorting domain-containing protein [Fimbriimonadaceae bacterium]
MRRYLLVPVLVISALGSATTTFYTSEVTWLGAVTNVSNYDFEGIADAGSFVYFGTGPMGNGPATFTSDVDGMFVVDKTYGGSGYFNSLASCLSAQITATNVHIDLGGGVMAMGLVYDNWSAADVPVSLSDGSSTSVAGGGIGTENFVGFISDGPITGVDLGLTSGDVLNIERFSVASVPEPFSLAVLSAGALALSRRRRR